MACSSQLFIRAPLGRREPWTSGHACWFSSSFAWSARLPTNCAIKPSPCKVQIPSKTSVHILSEQRVGNDLEAYPWSFTIRLTYLELWLLHAGLEPCRWALVVLSWKMPSNIDCMPPRAVLGEPRHRGSICGTNALVSRSQGRVRLTPDRELLGTSFAGEALRYDHSVMLAPSASR